MDLKTEVPDGRYEILKHLGKGNMGSVYLVKRISDGKELVIKKLIFSSKTGLGKEDTKEIFAREVEFLSRFNHHGLPEVYGTFKHDDEDYLLLEYIKGETLEEILNKSEGPLPVDKALKWAIGISEILDYLHNSFEAPIIYKDLKPSNIIITPEGKPRLIDFGTSRYYNPDKVTDTHRLGTPGYAAPEQYRGQSTAQSDLFSLGVILFQMLTKYDPTVTPLKFPEIKSLNHGITDKLESIIKRAIEKDSFRRYISVMELKETLEKYMGIPASSESYQPVSNISSYKRGTALFQFLKGLIYKTPFSPICGIFNYLYFTIFVRQFASMIKTGLPVKSSLDAISCETKDRKLLKVLKLIIKNLENGIDFSRVLLGTSSFFSPLFINLIDRGNDRKKLDIALSKFADFLEVDLKLQKKIKWVSTYPCIIIAMVGGVSYFIIAHMLPPFVDLFEGMDLTLPLPTKILIYGTKLLRNPFIMGPVIITIILLTIITKKFIGTRKGRILYDRLKLSLPIFGAIHKKFLLSRFCHIFSILISINIPLRKALVISAESAGNEYMAEKVREWEWLLDSCETIAVPLSGIKVFPPLIVEMIRKGEETEKLEEALLKISYIYNDELNVILEGLASKLEVIIITGMVLAVGFIVSSVFMPQYQLGSGIR